MGQDLKKALSGKHPEQINFDRPPAKLLAELYKKNRRKGAYKKVTDGKNLFDKLNPAQAYAACPFLQRMLDEMVSMARQAGL